MMSGTNTLKSLLQSMTEDQQLSFKKAVVRQAIHYVSKKLPPKSADEGHSWGILAATRWLNEPTKEVAIDVVQFATGECWDGGVRYHDYPAEFLDPAWVVGGTDIDESARFALQSVPKPDQEDALRWQIASAQAILRSEEVPALI
jgi:hypothetical protein